MGGVGVVRVTKTWYSGFYSLFMKFRSLKGVCGGGGGEGGCVV